MKLVDQLTLDLNTALEAKRAKQETLDYLSEQAATMERRLNAAEKLLTGLGREEERWTEDEKGLMIKVHNLTGDCLTTSAFLSYAGPFDFTFRKKMVY